MSNAAPPPTSGADPLRRHDRARRRSRGRRRRRPFRHLSEDLARSRPPERSRDSLASPFMSAPEAPRCLGRRERRGPGAQVVAAPASVAPPDADRAPISPATVREVHENAPAGGAAGRGYRVPERAEDLRRRPPRHHGRDVPCGRQSRDKAIRQNAGPSGCGKSTILRLIAGLTPQHPPRRGRCREGAPVGGRAPTAGWCFRITRVRQPHGAGQRGVRARVPGVDRCERYERAREGDREVGSMRGATSTSSPTSSRAGVRQRVAMPAR